MGSADYWAVTVGRGEPIATVFAGVHGNESAPVRGLQRLLDAYAEVDVERAFRLVVCNLRAVAAGSRFVDRDLNRAFPGDPTSRLHEDRLAHALLTELPPTPFNFDIHSTTFDVPPYGIVHSAEPKAVRQLPVSPLRNYVLVTEPSLISCLPCAQAFEVGRDDDPRSPDVAYRLAEGVLGGLGCLPGVVAPARARPSVHQITGILRRRDFRSFSGLRDFEPVPAGSRFGTSLDGEPAYASASFVPIWVNEPNAVRVAAPPDRGPSEG